MTAGQVARPYDVIKRGLDFVGAIACLIVSIPLQLVVAIFVRIKLGKRSSFVKSDPVGMDECLRCSSSDQ